MSPVDQDSGRVDFHVRCEVSDQLLAGLAEVLASAMRAAVSELVEGERPGLPCAEADRGRRKRSRERIPAVEPERLLTAAEVGAFLGLSKNHVYTLAKAGELPSLSLRGMRRFERSELEHWLRDHE
jgi:excisionase family DNA binding protein